MQFPEVYDFHRDFLWRNREQMEVLDVKFDKYPKIDIGYEYAIPTDEELEDECIWQDFVKAIVLMRKLKSLCCKLPIGLEVDDVVEWMCLYLLPELEQLTIYPESIGVSEFLKLIDGQKLKSMTCSGRINKRVMASKFRALDEESRNAFIK